MDYIKTYADFLDNKISVKKSLNVVFDSSNGTAGLVLRKINFKRHGINTLLINEKPNGDFPAHGPDPVFTQALRELKKVVLKNKSDLGVAFDADGDRAVFIDNKGRVVPPHIIFLLLSIIDEKNESFLLDMQIYRSISLIKRDALDNAHISKTGSYFIKKAMRKNKYDYGAEETGHYYFNDFYFVDSGIFASLSVINAISRLPYRFSDFVDMFPKIYEVNKSIRFKNDRRAKYVLKKITSGMKRKRDAYVSDFGDSWFMIRLSNTEPVLRFYSASLNKDKPSMFLVNILKKIKKS